MSKEIEVAKRVIVAFLGTNVNVESVSAIYEINSGNKEILLEHIKALKSIFEVAIRDLEGDDKVE